MFELPLPGHTQRLLKRLIFAKERNRRIFFSHPNVEVTLLPHDEVSGVFPRHDREVLIVRNAWYPDNVATFVREQRKRMGKSAKKVHFLSNTEELHRERLRWGFNSHFININCFTDESVFKPAASAAAKLYDAVAIGRFSRHKGRELKRHDLMSKIDSLALLDPVYGSTDLRLKQEYCSRSNCRYHNRNRLTPHQVVEILRQSHCGLTLSAHEGACRASCEYLAAGLPVVSTPSVGGRDVWFDDYNSIIVSPDPADVREAVEFFKNHPRDPELIRRGFLEKARTFRERFKSEVLAPILREHQVGLSADEVLRANPFFWWPEERNRQEMRTSDVMVEFEDFGIGNVSTEVIIFILEHIERGSHILEFGSGLSSRELSKAYNVTSIEHDKKFLNLFHNHYVHSELDSADLHYREADCREVLGRRLYDVVLVDGPPAYKEENRKSRLGFQKYVESFKQTKLIIFDDVDRWWDCINLAKCYMRLKRNLIVIEDEEGNIKSAVLTQDRPTVRCFLLLLYLLWRASSYRYDGR